MISVYGLQLVLSLTICARISIGKVFEWQEKPSLVKILGFRNLSTFFLPKYLKG